MWMIDNPVEGLGDFASKLAPETFLLVLVIGSRFPKLSLRRFEKAHIHLLGGRSKEFFSGNGPEVAAL